MNFNDPFDLWALAQPDAQLRSGIKRWKKQMTESYGVLCFSRSWRNPLLWSHYAERHQGFALGFDFEDGFLKEVGYTNRRPVFTAINEKAVRHLLYTKFADWKYEQEVRVYLRLQDKDPDSALYFAEFSDKLALREVIVGPLCKFDDVDVRHALGRHYENVRVTKARLAFNSFEVCKQQRGFRKSQY